MIKTSAAPKGRASLFAMLDVEGSESDKSAVSSSNSNSSRRSNFLYYWETLSIGKKIKGDLKGLAFDS